MCTHGSCVTHTCAHNLCAQHHTCMYIHGLCMAHTTHACTHTGCGWYGGQSTGAVAGAGETGTGCTCVPKLPGPVGPQLQSAGEAPQEIIGQRCAVRHHSSGWGTPLLLRLPILQSSCKTSIRGVLVHKTLIYGACTVLQDLLTQGLLHPRASSQAPPLWDENTVSGMCKHCIKGVATAYWRAGNTVSEMQSHCT